MLTIVGEMPFCVERRNLEEPLNPLQNLHRVLYEPVSVHHENVLLT